MKRNTALFGASAAVGLTAAAGLIMTSATSSAAAAKPTLYGVAYQTDTAAAGFAFGTISNPDGVFAAKAAVEDGVSVVAYTAPLLPGAATVGVATGCKNGAPVVVVTGGGAAGTYTKSASVSYAKFIGNTNAVGTVSFLQKAGNITIGASYNPNQPGQFVSIGGVSGCDAVTTTTGPTSTTTSPTTGPTSTSTTGPTSTSTTGPTSTSPTTGPTSTSTSPTGGPTSTTQPPTPTATTTTLPVTG